MSIDIDFTLKCKRNLESLNSVAYIFRGESEKGASLLIYT